jgi:DNA-binding GntR family transcriptional regulator
MKGQPQERQQRVAQQRVGSAHQPLRVIVCDEIRRRIIAGMLPQGERILEDQLAVDLGVSRNPVREALQTLAHEGFVDLEPRRGAKVTIVSDARAGELFAVREPLEGLVAALAAANRDDAQLAEIQHVVDEGLRLLAADQIDALPELNTRYHRLLVETAGNELLSTITDGLTHVIEWMYTRRVRERGLWSWDEHAAITTRIAERDVEGARELACEHIRNARDAYFASPKIEPVS